jgi:hypothetical protein
LSIFGFPGVKLKAWQHQKEEEHQQDDPNTALVFALDAILEEIFQQITKELSFKSTSLQFAFDGANTSLNLPLSLMVSIYL